MYDKLETKPRFKLRGSDVIYEGVHLGLAEDLVQREKWNRGEYTTAEINSAHQSGRGDGVWLHHFGKRFLSNELLDLHVPFDERGNEIKIGDVIMYARRDLTVSRMKVTSFDDNGREVTLKGLDLHTNKKTKNSYPNRCVNLTPGSISA